MKQYIKDNLTPLAIGAIITFSFCKVADLIDEIVYKIVIIQNDKKHGR